MGQLAVMIDREDAIPTRRSLLIRLRDLSDEASWRDFFETYWGLIYRTARKAGLNKAESEDVVQETLASICRTIGRFDYAPEKGSFKNYLLTLTGWRIRDQQRKRLRRREGLQGDEQEDPIGSGSAESAGRLSDAAVLDTLADPERPKLETIWEEEWRRNLMEAAIRRVKAKVSEKQYQYFDLSELKGWSVSKVAAAFQVRTASVYLARHRVGALIRREIRKLEKEWS